MKELTEQQLLYLKERNIDPLTLEDIWYRVSDMHQKKFGIEEKDAEEDADGVIEAIATRPEDDESVCIDPELGAKIVYFALLEYLGKFTPEEIKEIEEHLETCHNCSESYKEFEEHLEPADMHEG